ncbi:MAG: energy-coupling factor ABC transporter ATP-binding protein [Synergistaceae bacterium]|nr:energy-coupling factor ABC transporter ATP-binding protein [Synergistaceae bacterium]
METVLELVIKSLTFPGAKSAALKESKLSVRKGEFIAIKGPAGAGKSLLLHTITGAAMKYEGGVLDGSVILMGNDITELSLPAVSEYVGYMSQEPRNQIVGVTVEEEVAFGMANLCRSRQEIAKRSEEALFFVGLTGLEKRKTTSLSGGQTQRLAFAGILASKAPILLLDQPGAELDERGKREMYALIKKLHREDGVTVIMAADKGVDIAAFADRIVEMENGTIKKETAAADYRASLPYRGGRSPAESAQKKGGTTLVVDDVSFAYKGGAIGCEHISFTARRGNFLAVMGANGGGKTTLLKLLAGLIYPDRGAITVFDRVMTRKSAYALRSKMGFIFQNPDLQIFADTVRDEAAFALSKRPLGEEERACKTTAALHKAGLAGYEDLHPQRLSRGQRRKLAVASALAHDPEIVIADEPTAGLDEGDSRSIMDWLADFCAIGRTVILVSHDLELVASYADRVFLLNRHRLEAQYTRSRFARFAARLMDGGEWYEAV